MAHLLPERKSIMDNKIEVFKNEQFGEIRTALIENEPWFVAVDVCRALEIGNSSQAISRLDADEKMITLISNEGNKRGNPNMTVVNEPGLYTLILSSRKPEAKAFKRWITHDVIPMIRKTGGYMTDSLLERIQKEPAVIVEFAQALILEKHRVKALECELNTAKPKADYGIVDCRSFKNTSEEIIPKTLNLHILITDKPQIDEHIETDKKLYNTPCVFIILCKENKPQCDGYSNIAEIEQIENIILCQP